MSGVTHGVKAVVPIKFPKLGVPHRVLYNLRYLCVLLIPETSWIDTFFPLCELYQRDMNNHKSGRCLYGARGGACATSAGVALGCAWPLGRAMCVWKYPGHGAPWVGEQSIRSFC